jgi:hypothetical protein
MSPPTSPRVVERVPLKFRRKSLSADEDMPVLDSDYPNDPSSPIPSSSLPPTPFSSSSPPAYPRVHRSSGIAVKNGLGEYIDDQDHISTVWSRGYPRRSGFLKGIYTSIPATLSSYSDDEPPLASDIDASVFSDDLKHGNRGLSPDGTDGDDEDEEFEDVRQTCFAVSSERGRWKSSPIPMKTHSRSYGSTSMSASRPIRQPIFDKAASIKPNLTPFNLISGKSISRLPMSAVEWRRPSTGSSVSDLLHSPIARTSISKSEEPPERLRTSSPLPPSSPPMSPVSGIHSTFETDYTTEEDMLVDSDDEPAPQHAADSAPSEASSRILIKLPCQVLNPLSFQKLSACFYIQAAQRRLQFRSTMRV